METFVLILLAVAGILIHLGTKFVDGLTKKGEKSFGEFWEDYDWATPLAVSAVSLLIAIVLIVIRNEDDGLAGFPITKTSAVVLGYTADSIWKNLQSRYTKAN
jgi:hypothetical protein